MTVLLFIPLPCFSQKYQDSCHFTINRVQEDVFINLPEFACVLNGSYYNRKLGFQSFIRQESELFILPSHFLLIVFIMFSVYFLFTFSFLRFFW